jgi:hypothetical protein
VTSSGGRALERVVVPLVIAVVALAAWDTPFVYPVKIFVVLLHELSHGLAAVATGGTIERIELSADQGGVCWTRGGWSFVVLSAGYLGSLVAGAGLLVVAARTRLDRAAALGLGVVVLLVTALWVRSAFGLGYGLAAGGALVVVGWKLPAVVSDVVLRVIGVVSCLYVPWDIATDLVLRSHPGSDATQLGRMTGIPGLVWGVLWGAAAVVLAGVALRVSTRGGLAPRPTTPVLHGPV